mmetsp:Transcript_7185/g.10616  ORF Transcript_7185/g.10616 Transcript_7185/m.10616 type:complete len:82 (-) Transcript_7185:39-284(-)
MQADSQEKLNRMMMYEELKHYNELVGHCFKECILSMSSKKLNPQELTCLENCYKKNSNFDQRFLQALNYANMVHSGPQSNS